MTAGDFALLLMPVCAALAGLILWVVRRGDELADGELVGQFTLLVMLATVLTYGIGRTDFMRLRLNPQLKVERTLETQPVYAAIGRTMPEYRDELRAFVMGKLAGGATLDDAFVQARPMLTRMAKARLGFADRPSHIGWGKTTMQTLQALQKYDTDACYQAVASQALDPETLAHAFGQDDNTAFQNAVVEVFDSRYQPTLEDKSAVVAFNDGMREYDAIRQALSKQYGATVSEVISRNQFPVLPKAPAAEICAARIAQLEEILKRPKPMAAFLVDAALR